MAAASSPSADSDSSPRERLSFNEGWRFLREEFDFDDLAAAQPDFDDRKWRRVDLPHDWGIEGPFNQEYPGETGKLPWWGTGWYRKEFTPPAESAGKRVFIEFDGAMSHAEVWLNGKPVGGWPYGYASFQLELTEPIKPGEKNILAVRLKNPPDSSRWYPGGGIYRNVWLSTTAPVHVGHWGVFVTTPQVSPEEASVQVKVEVRNQSTSESDIVVESRLYRESGGKTVGEPAASAPPADLRIAAGGKAETEIDFEIKRPALWSLEAPHRYIAVTELRAEGRLLDRYETPFGIRRLEFTADKGFLLNGQQVPLNGVCNHHDLGALGAAVHPRAIERQLELLQEMGANAIRTSHNPPAPELLDLCDRMGLLVIVEAFDCWKRAKKPNDYSTLFEKWHEKDLRAMIRRDRNHPSVILWSTGNEIGEQGGPEGHALSRELTRIAHEEDPTRLATAGCNFPEAGYNGFQKTVDVFGYNYKPHEYGKFREENPDIPLYGSETASTLSSRGEYFFPVSDEKLEGRANFQVSSYDLSAAEWSTPPDAEFEGLDRNPFAAGEFVWTGFDYLGEPTPYNADATNLLNFTDPAEREKMRKHLEELGKVEVPSRSSYFGILDLAGFKKDRFYIYQARWRPDYPMAHILPHWNWPERVGEITPVHVYSSGDEAELFLNGVSQGRRIKGTLEYRFRWDQVRYEPGELRVVTRKNGQPWAEVGTSTTGPASGIVLTPDRDKLVANGGDLSFVTVAIADSGGRTVPRSHHSLKFTLDGPGEIVAVDNGDPTSHASFQASDSKACNGLCLVIVRTKRGVGGEIRLAAQSGGLADGEVVLSATC